MSGRQLSGYEVAGHYDEEYFADLSARYRRRNRFARQRIKNVFALLPELRDRRLLDLGCGMGTFTIEAASRGARAVGLDLVTAALKAAARVAHEEKVADARFVQGDAARLPVRDGVVDIVLAADVTEHLDELTLRRMLAEARRVLAPKGRLVLYTPEAAHVFERLRARGVLRQDPSHIGLRTLSALTQLVRQAGFEIERTAWLPSHLPGLQMLEMAFARWVPWLRRRAGLVARREA
jgi:cyclopropane fatty-acyl-phospholipid synthase-like methyltransferase